MTPSSGPDPSPEELLERARACQAEFFAQHLKNIPTPAPAPVPNTAAPPTPHLPPEQPAVAMEPTWAAIPNRPTNIAAKIAKFSIKAFILAFIISMFTINTSAEVVADFCVIAIIILAPVILISSFIGIIHWIMHR